MTSSQAEAIPSVVYLDSWAILNVTLAEATDQAAKMAQADYPSLVVTPNAQHMRLLRRDSGLRAAYEMADMRLPDGMPLVWASRVQGTPLQERVTGADLEQTLCGRLQDLGGRVLYIGGRTPEINERAVANRRAEFPRLEVKGRSPSMQFGQDPKETTGIIEFINDTSVKGQPTSVFICAGAPKSEIWASQNLHRIRHGVVIPVGAAIDYAAGTQQRASEGMRRHGFEWLHRMLGEPSRMAPRYARDAIFLAGLMCRSLLARRGTSR